jgi:hypothetical protein
VITCPLDHSALTRATIRAADDQMLLTKLDQLTLRCPHASCQQSGSYLQITVHRHTCRHGQSSSQPFTTECAPLAQFNRRNVAELRDLQYTIERLHQQFERQKDEAEQVIQSRLEQCGRRSRQLTQRLFTLHNHLTQLVHPDSDRSLTAEGQGPVDKVKTPDQLQLAVAYARNLDQFLDAHVLQEFLRQSGVRVVSCEAQMTAFERSRDFRIEFLQSDAKRLLNSNLWPIGVCVHLRCPSTARSPLKPLTSTEQPPLPTIIYGQRSDPPTLLIKSGFIY